MKVAFLGVSHWHARYYMPGLIDVPDVQLVGVADAREHWAEEVAGSWGTAAYRDYRLLIERERPDLVFAFGRHSEMAAEARFLIESGVPFAIEKPGGITLAEVEANAALARERHAFAAVPFTMRMTPFRRLIAELSPGTELSYGLFRQIPGTVDRYRDWGAGWHLELAESGGGAALNLGIHFYDLVHDLAPSADWDVAGAVIGRRFAEAEIDDLGMVLLRGGDAIASIETGYLPNSPREFIVEAVVGADHYRWTADDRRVVARLGDGRVVAVDGGLDQADFYPDFVQDTIRRVREGAPPATGLDELVRALRLVERAYRRSGDTRSLA